jgi:hypothetical protein
VQIVADAGNDDLARIDADPDHHRHAVAALDLVGIARDVFLHPQRRITGAHGMILVRQRRAEQRHETVAHDGVDGALVAVHGLDHALEHRVEKLLHVLRITVGDHLHRAFDVGEQHCDQLALAFECGARDENLIGDVLGRVILGRSEAQILFDRPQRMSALQAESGRRGDLAAAIAAASGQRSCTLLAEPRLSGVLVLTFRAFHSTPQIKIHDKTQAGSNTKLPSRSIGNKAIVPAPGAPARAFGDHPQRQYVASNRTA